MPPRSYNSVFNSVAGQEGTGINAPVDELGRTALHVSIKNGDMKSVVKLLRYGADSTQPDRQGQPPLYEAITARNLTAIDLLLQNGATFLANDDKKRNPLMWAIEQNCDIEFLKRLHDLGLSLGVQNEKGCSALHTAAAHDRPDIIDYLIENDVAIDLEDSAGKTAVHLAVTAKAQAALGKLLALGASPLHRDKKNETPLYAAVATGNEAAVDLLLADPSVRSTVNVFQTRGCGLTPLMAAALANRISIAEKLLAVGADPNQRDSINWHSLLLAVEGGHIGMVKLLIREGADIRDIRSSTPAQEQPPLTHRIFPGNYAELLSILHAAGADLDAIDNNGVTAMHIAASKAATTKTDIKALLELGADPNLMDVAGRRPIDIVVNNFYSSSTYEVLDLLLSHGALATISPSLNMQSAPLHMAVKSGRRESVRLLLAHGAIIDEQERFDDGKTPFLLAIKYGHIGTARLLLQKGADPLKKDRRLRNALHIAAQTGQSKFMDSLLKIPELKRQIDAPDADGQTPLHYACRAGQVEIAQSLIENGANLQLHDADGLFPLHYAVASNSARLLSVFVSLIKNKNDWNIQCHDTGETPLHKAIKSWAYPATIQRLLDLGADTTIMDKRGLTPLHLAVMEGNFLIAEILLDHINLKKIPLDQYRDNRGFTALHYAAEFNAWRIFPLLLAGGADINAVTTSGDTPLHLAVRARRADIIDLLIAGGANLHLANAAGETPFDIAAAQKDKDEALVKKLTPAMQPQKNAAAKTARRRPSP